MSMSGPLTFAGMVIVTALVLAPDLGQQAEVASQPQTSFQAEPADTPRRSQTVGNGYASRELERSPDGHFYVEGQVNGAQVRFLVDTGATFVALTAADAQRAGIAPRTERTSAMSAGGEVEIMPVTIDRVALGPLVADHVGGAVIEALPISLLGQSYLSRIGSVRIEGDRMTLR